MTYTLNIYYIVLHYKDFFFKHMPDVAYTLKIYDVIVQHKESLFETYTRYNFYFEYT